MIYVGSARISETGGVNGQVGDQKQKNVSDFKGEVAQEKFYVHSLGWYILRPKKIEHANKIAKLMITACDNANIGYGQSNRNGVVKYGINTKTKCNCDCSSLVREVVKEACGKDAGNFTTINEKQKLLTTGLFEDKGKYSKDNAVYDGDVLVTCKKGHTVVVTSGNPRRDTVYFAKYTGESTQLRKAFTDIGETAYISLPMRAKIALANNLVVKEEDWVGSLGQNAMMMALLKNGTLIKP